MALETLTDEQIQSLLACAKRVENPQVREKTEGKHLRRDYRVVSLDGEHLFTLFTRQSSRIVNGFSAGLLWKSRTGEEVILLRCNGNDHEHPNKLERTRLIDQCHVHEATERYIAVGKKSEGYAQATTAYHSLDGALHHLSQRANIQGLKNVKSDETNPNQTKLFNQS